MNKVRRAIIAGVLLSGLIATGCTDAPLSGLGQTSQNWIAAVPKPTPTVPIPITVAPAGLQSINGGATVEWVNDGLGGSRLITPEEALSEVWDRSNKEDRFVQASRTEVAAALPGVGFPQLMPESVSFITSQLVFDPRSGEPSPNPAAAFGFWSAKPYSKSRSVAQAAVLMVAVSEMETEPVVEDNIGVPEHASEDPRCDDLVAGTVEECNPVTLDDGYPAWSLDVTDGWRLVWSRDGYEYDLFVRNADNADLLARIAGSGNELIPMAPVIAGPEVLEEQQEAPADEETEQSAEAAAG